MYQFLLRCMPATLAQIVMLCWYSGLLLALWLKWPAITAMGFRYGQI